MLITRMMMVLILALLAAAAVADAPLKSKLDLDVDQAKTVAEIQARYRAEMRTTRQTLHTENRKLRRARVANDSAEIARLEPIVESLRGDFRQIMQNQDKEIRAVLSAEQQAKFDAYIEQRKSMVGSSRDVKDM